MRTLQEVIKSLNVCKLVTVYLDEYCSIPISDKDLDWINKENNFEQVFLSTLTYQHKRIKKLFQYIERIKALDIQKSNDMILAYSMNNFYDKLSTSYIKYNDIINKPNDQIETYAYEFSDQKEIFGWRLPETQFVQENIYYVIANILYEASFFGYDQETLKENRQQLDEAIKEVQELEINKMKGQTFEDFKRKYNIEDDPKELIELRNQVILAENEYHKYLKFKELNEIRQLLEEGK